LDAKYADARVRGYAISIIDQLNDGDLSDYLLQLTQVLKYESNHDSALARFLIRRALNSKDIIGHSFFWSLKAEMHVPEIRERYGLLLEAYLRGCGSIYRGGLFKQNDIVDQLTNVALKIKTVKKEERLDTVRFLLRQIDFPDRFQLPLFTNVECKGLIIDKCKVMVRQY
jgi:phosphatidylinositol-4,5-bisphosphate 3-kinase